MIEVDSAPVKALFSLLRLALGNQNAQQEKTLHLEESDWQQTYHLSLKQGLGAIAWDGLLELSDCNIGESLRFMWMGQCLVIEKDSRKQMEIAKQLADYYAKNGIKPFVLKGFAFSSLYPIPIHRVSNDLDVFLFNDFEKGNALVEEFGYKVDRSQSKHSFFDVGTLHVENHQFCVNVKGNKKYKEVERRLRELITIDAELISDTQFYRPGLLFNALFGMYHAKTHFIVEGGISLKHVCDWILLKRKLIEESLLGQFWQESESFMMTKFAVALDEVASYVMGESETLTRAGRLMLNDIFNAEESKFSSSKEVIRTVWKSRWKYSYFSDSNAYKTIATFIFGYLFDKNPEV